MATLNSNNAALIWDGVDVSGYFTDAISLEQRVGVEDVTAGAGATHEMLAARLGSSTLSFAVVYDAAALTTYQAVLAPGQVGEMVWGPEGAAPGRPCHAQHCVLERVAVAQTVDKQKVAFVLTFRGAAAPTKTLTGPTAGTF